MTTDRAPSPIVYGSRLPRIGVTDTPEHTDGPTMAYYGELGGFDAFPWQRHGLDVVGAFDPANGRWKYSEIAWIVSRQNGKTDGIVPRIVAGLIRYGDTIYHAAQNLTVPRETFDVVAEAVAAILPNRAYQIRTSNGKERISVLRAGHRVASYRLLPPDQAAWRGPPATLLIFDEYREYFDSSVIAAARPKLISAKPSRMPERGTQIVYLSNAGTVLSAPLLGIRSRALSTDPGRLAYLEWSADPLGKIDDVQGWRQANPSLGHLISLEDLTENFRTMTEADFRTEHLCQFVDVASDLAFPIDAWKACEADDVEPARPISLAIDVDPYRREATAVAAWNDGDRVRVAVAAKWVEPLDDAAIALEVEQMRRSLRADKIHYDALTAFGIADKLRDSATHRVTLTALVAASAATYDAITSGRLAHHGDDYLTTAVSATGRKAAGDGGWRLTRRGPTAIPASVAMTLAVAAAATPRPKLEIR